MWFSIILVRPFPAALFYDLITIVLIPQTYDLLKLYQSLRACRNFETFRRDRGSRFVHLILYGHYIRHIERVRINRVRLPILLVVS